MTTFESRAIKSRFGKDLVVKHKRDDVHLVCSGIDGDGGHLRIFKRADLLWALDATANTDVKHRADAYADATRAQDDAREWKARAEDAEKDLARTRAELDRTRETYEAELAEAEREERAALEKATALRAQLDKAEATLARIKERVDASPSRWIKAQYAEAVREVPPFELPTQVPARIEAKRGGKLHTFYLWTNGEGGANDMLWINEDSWTDVKSGDQIMDKFTDHRVLDRLIGADQ